MAVAIRSAALAGMAKRDGPITRSPRARARGFYAIHPATATAKVIARDGPAA
ncbi:MAG: hypothetical protein WED27_03880 [Pirellulales bacterium]